MLLNLWVITVSNNLIKRATEIAKKVHGDQVDKKKYPYMAHILDIASRVSHLGENYEITALLHDAIEDAEPERFKREIISAIEKEFSEIVLKAIFAMTKKKDWRLFCRLFTKVKGK